MKNKFLLTEEESQRIKSLHKKFGYRSGLLTEAEYLNQDRPNDPFQYLKVDDGSTTKYYYKGVKGDPLKQYPNWTEATGNRLGAIQKLVTFKTTAETSSQLSTTQKTDEELYTEYFNKELKQIKPEQLPKGKITKLTDGTYGYVLDDGSYTLLSDGYSMDKNGVKSTNKWTETPFVKPVVGGDNKTNLTPGQSEDNPCPYGMGRLATEEEINKLKAGEPGRNYGNLAGNTMLPSNASFGPENLSGLIGPEGQHYGSTIWRCERNNEVIHFFQPPKSKSNTGKSIIDLISEYLKSKYPTIQIPQTVLDTLKTLLTGIDATVITKITEFLTAKTGTIEDLLALIPESIKTKILELLKSIPNLLSTTSGGTTQTPIGGDATRAVY
jgi:hypothetical protein